MEPPYQGDLRNFVDSKFISTDDQKEVNNLYCVVQNILNNPNFNFQDLRDMLNPSFVEKSIMIESETNLLQIDRKNHEFHHNFDKNAILLKIQTYQKL